jgi:hypothetical protein
MVSARTAGSRDWTLYRGSERGRTAATKCMDSNEDFHVPHRLDIAQVTMNLTASAPRRSCTSFDAASAARRFGGILHREVPNCKRQAVLWRRFCRVVPSA